MKKTILLILVALLPIVLFAQIDELKAKLADNPADIESLEALLKIYEDNYDYYSYLDTVRGVASAVGEIPDEMLPIIEKAIEMAQYNYYSDMASELSRIYFDADKNRQSLLFYLQSLNSAWYLSESDVRDAVAELPDEEPVELYRYLYDGSVELYPADLSLIVSRILVEEFNENDFLLPYIKGLFYDGDYRTSEELLNEYSEVLVEQPMFYYLKSILELIEGNYEQALDVFLKGKAYDDGSAMQEAFEVLYYVYVPEYVMELFRAIVTSDDEATLQANIQEYISRFQELSWIFSWISRVPEPKKISELLEGEEVVISYNVVNFDTQKIITGFFDIDGVLQGSLNNTIYGQFLDARSFIYISAETDRVIVDGERKARFMGYDVYSLAPDRSKFLLLESYGEKIVMVGPDLTTLWSADGEFNMIPPSWSPDSSRVAVSTGYDVFSVFDTATGELLEQFDYWYDFVFLSNDNAYAIDYEGSIIDLTTDESLDTSAYALWAEFGVDGKILYYEQPEDYEEFYYQSLRVFDISTGADRLLAENVLFMDAPVSSIKVEGPYVYFTEKDPSGMHRVVVLDYTTNELLFRGKLNSDILIFPDVRPE